MAEESAPFETDCYYSALAWRLFLGVAPVLRATLRIGVQQTNELNFSCSTRHPSVQTDEWFGQGITVMHSRKGSTGGVKHGGLQGVWPAIPLHVTIGKQIVGSCEM